MPSGPIAQEYELERMGAQTVRENDGWVFGGDRTDAQQNATARSFN